MEGQAVHVVGKVGQRHLCCGTGDADGTDDEAHLVLLPGEDMLDARPDCGSAPKRDHPLIQHRRLKLFKKPVPYGVPIGADRDPA